MLSSTSTVDEYLETLDPETRTSLAELRAFIRAAFPRARETIRYGTPHFEHHGLLCALGKKRGRLTLRVLNDVAIEQMREHLFGIEITKGRIRIDDPRRLPRQELLALLERAARLNEHGVGVYDPKKRTRS